jgi:hypothetical protein
VGPDFIHWQVEAAKLASRTVIPFTAIPFLTAPVEILPSDAYNAKRQVFISERASLHQRPGAIPGHGKMLETRVGSDRTVVGSSGAREPTVGRMGESKGDTVHFDIVDRFGNMVSATPSGGWLRSSPAFRKLASASGHARRCSRSINSIPRAQPQGSVHVRPSHPPWLCETVNPTLLGTRREETSRTNGSRNFSSDTFMPSTISKRRSTPQGGIPSIFLLPFGPASPASNRKWLTMAEKRALTWRSLPRPTLSTAVRILS